ncbi:hypothetical protein PybrP1_000461 [[Pythium] brassicae (nom. inval.)]|nr:hypothetical protein PybrP1_000461 [[Pythium] brassicae (nom. inval.)]
MQRDTSKHEARLCAVRRSNSERARRYRHRKKEAVELTLDRVEALRGEIAELGVRRQRLLLRAERALGAPESHAARLVHEYFAVFRRGVDPRLPADRNSAGGARQEAFLRTMAHPAVAFGEHVGVATLIDQWRRYSAFHASVRLELSSVALHSLDGCPVAATSGVMHLRYSRTTLEKLFPHVLVHEPLVQRLVGREVRLRYRDVMYFNERGQMTRYELMPDLISALLDAVGSLSDVLLLLGSAQIAQDAVIRRSLQDADSDDDGGGHTSGSGSPTSSLASNSPPPSIMDIQFILS